MAVKLTAENYQSEVVESRTPVVLEFYSDSCLPCKRLAPLLAELEEEFSGRFKLCKIHAGTNEEFVRQYGVLSAPTLIFLAEGKEQRRVTGFVEKKLLQEMMKQILEGAK